MLEALLQAYLRGEFWPVILPGLCGGADTHGKAPLTASPPHPHWMKSGRRWPVETFTRLDFLRAAKAFGGLGIDARDNPFAQGYHGLINIPLDRYTPFFIEAYIEKLSVEPKAVAHWCRERGWPVPVGLESTRLVSIGSPSEVAASTVGIANKGPEERGGALPTPDTAGAEKARMGTGKSKYEEWETKQRKLCKRGMTNREAAKQIAKEAGVDISTVERETRRVRRERESGNTN